MQYDFNDELRTALTHAMELEYAKYPDPDELDYEYWFSDEFEKKMKKIRKMPKQTYVSFGRRRLRLLTAVALIAVMLCAMTAGAVAGQRLYVKWNETVNDEDGTLDITFDIDDPNQAASDFRFVKPQTPEGYHIESEVEHSSTEYEVQYVGKDGSVIYYTQSGKADSTQAKLDTDSDYNKIWINGYEGYSYEREGNSALIWSDGVSFYVIIGTCDLNILKKMVEE